ncbi:MAG: 1,6-anhydro-N-acetylmuramyl-L-alanine amidase AmpD [Mariprofundales bacterium]|nr:1,6-anhydro-N-acetylmuramyl-L-alanine amidase AmpD [Mariprofundales bacterium]
MQTTITAHSHPSPHCDDRPQGDQPSLIVLHAISLPPGEFGTAAVRDLFLGSLDCSRDIRLAELEQQRLSAHTLIDRHGDIMQFVPLHRRAWHAGVSCWRKRSACNDFSIGIEMIGDETTPFTNEQYRTCAALCHTIMRHFTAITTDAIVGHQDIAPGRKWDPGKQWRWAHFEKLLNSSSTLPTISGLEW